MRSAPLLLLAACGHRPPSAPLGPPDLDGIAGPASTCDHITSTWVDREVGRDHVRFAAGLEVDADEAALSLAVARSSLSAELAVPSEDTLEAWVWLTTASERIKSGVAMTRSYETQVTLLLYSPSCDPRPGLFDKLLLQQLSGEYLRAATVQSELGWKLDAGPAWFVQGAEGWLTSCLHEPPPDRLSHAISVAKTSPDGAIRAEGTTIAVADPRRDGLAIIGWLSATRGQDTLVKLLASDAETFDGALVAVVGADAGALANEYLQWRIDNK